MPDVSHNGPYKVLSVIVGKPGFATRCKFAVNFRTLTSQILVLSLVSIKGFNQMKTKLGFDWPVYSKDFFFKYHIVKRFDHSAGAKLA